MSQQVPNTVVHQLSSIALSHLLTSNEVPNAFETSCIHQGLNNLQSEISRLQSQLYHLENLSKTHRSVLSAVRRLPFEVLGRIFSFVPSSFPKIYERQELLHLTQVCRRWCQAARLTHLLWSEFELEYGTSYEAAASWLSRSGNLPKTLNVRKRWCGHSRSNHHADFQQCDLAAPGIVKMLLEGPPLDRLHLSCAVPLCFQKLCEQLRPSLWKPIKSLSISIDDGWDQLIEGEVTSNSFDIPPSVTALSIDLGFSSNFGLPNRPLCISSSAYARLKSFSFSSTPAWSNGAAVLAALQYCANLEILTINFGRNMWKYDVEGYRAQSVSLPKLHTLHLHQTFETSILNYLIMPALAELVVRGSHYLELDYFWWNLPNPELRCPNLRIFRLYAPEPIMGPVKLATILQGLPHLTELTLSKAVCDRDDAEEEEGLIIKTNWGYLNEDEEEEEEEETLMDDVFQILHSWDQERGRARILPSLQVLEVLDLPCDYNFSYICEYLEGRLNKPPNGGTDTLKKLTVTFLPTREPNNCNSRDFENIHEKLEGKGIRASITPSKLEPVRRRDYWYLYDFRV